MSKVFCGADPCPVILNTSCVFYNGQNLLYTGIKTFDPLQTVIEKIDQAFQNSGLGYAFNNGLVQTTPFDPVQLGGSLIQNTTIGGSFTLTFVGNVEAAKHITTGGTASQFVKGDGTLDSTSYQPAGNYITALSGDGSASGPGVGTFTLSTVNVSPGTFGSSTLIPIVTVNSKGLVTNVTTVPFITPSQSLSFIGDVVGSGVTGTSVTLSLQNVNSNPYPANTFLKFAVNAKGLVTSATPVTSSDIVNALGYTPSSVDEVNAAKLAAQAAAQSAAISAGIATNEATNALNSANSASSSANSASASASTATSQATIATTQANLASQSATNALNSSNSSSASASNAATSASNALSSEQAAGQSASSALSSQQASALSESNALSSANSASASASTATAQAGIATTQAGIATTQAGNALTSANNALNSANDAAASAASASAVGTSTLLTGFATGSNTTILGTDTILGAFQKAQGQINARVSGTGSNGQVSFWSGTGTQSGSSNFTWDNVNNRFVIGGNLGGAFNFIGSFDFSDFFIDRYTLTFGAATAGIGLRKANGTFLSPTAVQSGDGLGTYGVRGYGTTGFSTGSRAGISGFATENFTNTAQGTGLAIFTTLNGGTITTRKMEVLGNGNVIIQNGGTFTDAGFRLDVNGTARIQGALTTNLTAGRVPFIGTGGVLSDSAFLTYNESGQLLTISGFRIRNQNLYAVESAVNIYNSTSGGAGVPFTQLGNLVLTPRTNTTNRHVFIATSSDGTTVDWRWQFRDTGALWGQTGTSLAINMPNGSTFGFDVNGTARVQGALTVTATARVTGSSIFDTSIGFGTDDFRATITPSGTSNRGITITDNAGGTANFSTLRIDGNATNGGKSNLSLVSSFTASTVNQTYNKLVLSGTYTELSGGIETRGIFINITTGAITNYRAIEWNNNTGWGLYGVGTALNYLNGNLLLGTTTSTGERLQVTGTTRLSATADSVPLTISGYSLTGSNAQSALSITGTWNTTGTPTALLVNVTDTASNVSSLLADFQVDSVSRFRFLKNSTLFFRAGSSIRPSNGTNAIATSASNGLNFVSNLPITLGDVSDYIFVNNQGSPTNTSGLRVLVDLTRGFAPTSGTGQYIDLRLLPAINQTGGANGITRGLFVNPTLTAAADWRSIEWSNNTGRGLWGVGTANNAMAGALNVGSASNANASAILELTSTTRGLLLPRMTSAQRDAIASPVAGLILYNTTDNLVSFYNGTAWTNL